MSTETPQATADAVGVSGLPITPVGVDVGERTLVAAATPEMSPSDAFTVGGAPVRRSYELLRDATTALQNARFDSSTGEAQIHAALYQRLRGQVIDAVVRTVRWARSVPGAVLVLEDLKPGDVTLWDARTDVTHFGAWVVPTLQKTLVERASKNGIPVARVDPDGTSRECHRCGERGEREGQSFRCTNPRCAVGDVDADGSAAVTIATRVGSVRGRDG